MELRQLRYFVAVAEEAHFGRAARRLHISQPPLSTQIRQLEEQLGVRLLDRTTRRVVLTDAGHLMLDRARSILAAVDTARHEVRHAEAGLRGRLTVGFISSATLSVLPPALRRFRSRFPAVELSLLELTSGQQIDALYQGDIRIGLLRLPLQAPGLAVERLYRESMLVAMPTAHPLAATPTPGIAEVAEHPLIFPNRQLVPGFHDHVVRLFHQAGAVPRIAQRATHLQTIIGLVASEVGVAILPESASHLQRDGVVYRPLQAESSETWLAVATMESARSALTDHFREQLHRTAANLAQAD